MRFWGCYSRSMFYVGRKIFVHFYLYILVYIPSIPVLYMHEKRGVVVGAFENPQPIHTVGSVLFSHYFSCISKLLHKISPIFTAFPLNLFNLQICHSCGQYIARSVAQVMKSPLFLGYLCPPGDFLSFYHTLFITRY